MKTNDTTTTPAAPAVEFTAVLIREFSAGPSATMGEFKNRMELSRRPGSDAGHILWNWGKDAPNEDEEIIGLWFEGMSVVDYDGVFDLPREARLLLIGAGYDLSPLGIDAEGNDDPIGSILN